MSRLLRRRNVEVSPILSYALTIYIIAPPFPATVSPLRGGRGPGHDFSTVHETRPALPLAEREKFAPSITRGFLRARARGHRPSSHFRNTSMRQVCLRRPLTGRRRGDLGVGGRQGAGEPA